MRPEDFRCDADRVLAARLLEHPRLQRAVEARAQAERMGTRRALLATALRLTPAVAPKLHDLLSGCVERLSVETKVELFVFASPQFNAACTAPEGGRVFVLLSSALVEAFDDAELAYVIGHELGHHVYGHHDVPVEVVADPRLKVPPSLVLEVRAWQRYAELSADRAGTVCGGGLMPAARSLFKLSSGFSRAPSADQIAAYIDQAEELYREVESAEQPLQHRDWLATHPFSPVRLSAVRAFARLLEAGSTDLTELEDEVHGLMALMEPGYLEEDTDEAEYMRRVLFAGGVLIAAAHEGISDAEVAALEDLLGPGRVPRVPDVEALRADLPKRLERARAEVRPARRAQVVRDLAQVATSTGTIEAPEQHLLYEIASGLGVHVDVVLEATCAPCGLD